MKIKLQLIFLSLLLCTLNSYAQNYVANQQSQSNLIIQGNKTLALSTPPPSDGDLLNTTGVGKLSSGELVRASCDHGACYFRINYNGKSVYASIGDNFSFMKMYEYDLGGDGDKELIVCVNQQEQTKSGDDRETTLLYIYRYSKGMLEKMFEKEIKMYKTIIKKNYIEFYMPYGLDAIWHYYHGRLYQMNPVTIKN